MPVGTPQGQERRASTGLKLPEELLTFKLLKQHPKVESALGGIDASEAAVATGPDGPNAAPAREALRAQVKSNGTAQRETNVHARIEFDTEIVLRRVTSLVIAVIPF